MASENPDVVEFELEADCYTLKRNVDGTVALLQDEKLLLKDLASAKIDDQGVLILQGSTIGKVNEEITGSVVELSEKLKAWYPPGVVNHAHTKEEFVNLNKEGIVVGKFSATWCGPCKRVAPAIEKLSLQYPDVTFIHMDEHEANSFFSEQGIGSYPTFKFWVNGKPAGNKVEGANAQKVEERIKALGATKVEIERTEEIVEESVTITCERDAFRVARTENGMSLFVNDDLAAPPGKCPHIEVNVSDGTISFGRGGGKLYLGGSYDLATIAERLADFFPSEVIHVHSTEEFDGIVSEGITCAKFSAEWCGPCKAIAGEFHNMSTKLEGKVKFLHIDVDEQKALSSREGIQAMPTFHFFVNGVKKADFMVRGANLPAVKANLEKLGVDMSVV